MKDLINAAEALLDLIWQLPDDEWANQFAEYSAPEVQRLARAVEDCGEDLFPAEQISLLPL